MQVLSPPGLRSRLGVDTLQNKLEHGVMNEPSAGGDTRTRFFKWVSSSSDLLRYGLHRDVRSSLAFSVSFESSLALVLLWGSIGYWVSSAVITLPK